MKILEIPVINEDGSILFTQYVGPEEAKTLLSFALNALAHQGLQVVGLRPTETSYEQKTPNVLQ